MMRRRIAHCMPDHPATRKFVEDLADMPAVEHVFSEPGNRIGEFIVWDGEGAVRFRMTPVTQGDAWVAEGYLPDEFRVPCNFEAVE